MGNKVFVATSSILYRLRERGFRIIDGCKLHTTGIVSYAVSGVQKILPEIEVHEFSSDEMRLFSEYYYRQIGCLKALGFYDSSAIYYALQNKIPVLVVDKVVERACDFLGLAFVNLEKLLEEELVSGSISVTTLINNHKGKFFLHKKNVEEPLYKIGKRMTG